MASRADVTRAAEPKCRKIADQMGFELVDVALDRESAGSYLRIYIDKPEGITLDDCETYHKAVRPLLESIDYDFMEVSSPGIDRPLKTEKDFERNLGAEVEVHLFRQMNGSKIFRGALAGLEGEDILLDISGSEVRIPRKAASLVKPVVDMEGIEDVDLTEGGENIIYEDSSGEETET